MKTCLQKLTNHWWIVLGLVVTIAILSFPLQHHIILSRFQHYGIALYAVVAGYLLQLFASWRKSGVWSRSALLASVVYYGALATVFLLNSWLDGTVALESEDQIALRHYLAAGFGIVSFPLGFAWLRAWAEEDLQLYLRAHEAETR